MTVLHTIAEAKGPLKLNAVFVHGLGGDWRTTWLHDGKDENFWPRQQQLRYVATCSLPEYC